MEKTKRVNQKCFVRHQDCKRIFEGSRICFIASPSSEEVALELKIIAQKLREVKIEPYIAVEQREFQKDIFCEKICSKIIESQFCIVLLNDVVDEADKIRKPNANVYYEYGLMTALGKKIIPIQLEGQSLAFNIQSLDTVKYTKGDLDRQIEEAIKIILLSIEEEEEGKVSVSHKLWWALDIMGLVKTNDILYLKHFDILLIDSLGFSLYNDPRNERLFFVLFRSDISDRDIVLNSKILTLRIKNYCEQLSHQIEQLVFMGGGQNKDLDLREVEHKFRGSMILVLKDEVANAELIKTEYEKSCKDAGVFTLDMKIINAAELIKENLNDNLL